MPATYVEEHLSSNDLLNAANLLSTAELDAFCDGLLMLRAERQVPHLSRTESELLQTINAELLPFGRQRYEELKRLRDEEVITPKELEELIELTEQMDVRNVERVKAIMELAKFRRISPEALMDGLGLGPKL